MENLSRSDEHPVDSSTAGFMNLEDGKETGNGQETEVDAVGSENLSDYTGANIRVLEGIEAIRLRLLCMSATLSYMACITW